MKHQFKIENSFDYRYGFNGKEKDDEVKGSGNSLDFGDRIYDPRTGRWLSTDKRFKDYVPYTPYGFALNNPIYLIDADGNVVVDSQGKPITVSVTEAKNGSATATYKYADGSEVTDKTFLDNGGRAINSAIQVQTGREQVAKIVASKDNIHITVNTSPDAVIKKDENGQSGLVLGKTNIPMTNKEFDPLTGEGVDAEVQDIEITINVGSIKKEQEKGFNASEATRGISPEQAIGAVLSHEAEHATNPTDRANLVKGKDLTKQQHKDADIKGNNAGSEFRKHPKQKK